MHCLLITNFQHKILISDYNLACIDIYCTRLQERCNAKEIVHDFQLMDKYFFSKEKPKRRLALEEKYISYFFILQ